MRPSDTPDESGSHVSTLTELELETALLRSIPEARPVGKHKHVIIMQLQACVHRRTGVWIDTTELWDKLGELYDLDGLDEMASSSISLPPSPKQLSPLLPPSTRHARLARVRARCHSHSSASASSSLSLSQPTDTPSPPRPESRSAGVINSKHFGRAFEIPLGDEIHETEGEEAEEEEGVGVGSKVRRWSELVYERAVDKEKPKKKGVAVKRERKAEEDEDGAGIVKGNGEEEEEEEEEDGGARSKRGAAKRKRDSGGTIVTTTTGRATREASEASSAAPKRQNNRRLKRR